MPIIKTASRFFLFYLLTLSTSAAICQQRKPKLVGNVQAGLHTNIYNNNRLSGTGTVEFTPQFLNYKLTTAAIIQHGKSDPSTGNAQHIILKNDAYTKELDVNLSVISIHEVVHHRLIKNTMELLQPSRPGILYILQQPTQPVEKLMYNVEFEYASFPCTTHHELRSCYWLYYNKKFLPACIAINTRRSSRAAYS